MSARAVPNPSFVDRAAGLDKSLIPAIGADGTSFPIDKLEAHRQGALHWAVSVFVFCGDALLIQRRADGKYHSGGLWANTCCSHPHWGESLEACAERRLGEELGAAVPLTPRALFQYRAPVSDGLVEHERVQIFEGRVRSRAELAMSPDPLEVSETRWAPLKPLFAEMRAAPERFAPWFRIYAAQWPSLEVSRMAAPPVF